MKRAILCTAGLLLATTSLHAQSQPQSIAGTWQGTLPIAATGQGSTGGNGVRIVFTIRKDPDNTLHAVMTPIDLGNSTPLTSVTLSAPNVTFALGDSVIFRGKLSPDGHSIAGTWGEGGPQTLPLTLSLATEDTLWHRAGPTLPPMAANADPSFDVATIKPAKLDEQHALFDLHARQFNATGMTATELIKVAYNVRGRQVLGGPPWLNDTRYDVVAEPDTPGLPSEDQTRSMVHKLLIERFHLVSHAGQQDYPVMALTLDPKGPPPKPSDASVNPNGGISGHRDGDDIVIQFSGAIHDLLAWMMNTFQDKQLVDETGLTGNYDVTLRLAGMAAAQNGGVSSDDYGNALVLAAQHAGFKLINKKAPLPTVIVDHIDLPTPN
jgi:uncharacterized protein (TIGR03435 family)